MSGNNFKIDFFTQKIIRRQFAIISAYHDDCNTEENINQSAALMTALENDYEYIIHRGKLDKGNAPLCFTVFNNMADKASNSFWQNYIGSYAKKHRQKGLIVGYDNVVLCEPLKNQPTVKGTIKVLKASHIRHHFAYLPSPYDTEDEIAITYNNLLKVYGKILGDRNLFDISEPYVFRGCIHKLQPYLTDSNMVEYYSSKKRLDKFYPKRYCDFAHSENLMQKATEQLKILLEVE